MNYDPIIVYQSQVSPGVKFHLRKMSHARRIQLRVMGAEAFAKLSEVESELLTVQAEIERAEDAARIEPCTCDHGPTVVPNEYKAEDIDPDTMHFKATGQCPHAGCKCREPKPDSAIGDYTKLISIGAKRNAVIIEELYPAYIRWGLDSVEGMTIRGKPVTADTLLAEGVEMFVGELGREIQRIIKMTPEEVLGFKLPSTSGAPTDGQMNDTSALPASETNGMSTGIASDTSQTQ